MVRGRVHVCHGTCGADRPPLSFRARSRDEVDSCYAMLKEIGAKIIFPAEPGPFWPGYYSVVFEDPDGTRLEMNYIPVEGWNAVAAAADAIARGKAQSE